MERCAAWRDEPSTARQINFLLRLGANSPASDILKVALTMNKGQASNDLAHLNVLADQYLRDIRFALFCKQMPQAASSANSETFRKQ